MNETTYRSKIITRADILRAMDRFDKKERRIFPGRRWKTYAVMHDGKLFPPKQILRIATGMKNIGGGGKPVNSRFEQLGFRIVHIGSQSSIPDEEITEDEAIETSFSLERDLEDSLVANLIQLEAGLRLYEDKSRSISGQQVDTQAVGRIDLLAVDTNDELVVIELKAGEADDQVCGQILRYMGWVKEKLADGRKARGIIVASEFSERLKYAAKAMPEITLKRYAINFGFTEIYGSNR